MNTTNISDLRTRLESIIAHLELIACIEGDSGVRAYIESLNETITTLEATSEEIRDKQVQITKLTERLARGRRYIRWSLSSDVDRDLKLDALADFLPRTPEEGVD
jgi:hypothetical protein